MEMEKFSGIFHLHFKKQKEICAGTGFFYGIAPVKENEKWQLIKLDIYQGEGGKKSEV